MLSAREAFRRASQPRENDVRAMKEICRRIEGEISRVVSNPETPGYTLVYTLPTFLLDAPHFEVDATHELVVRALRQKQYNVVRSKEQNGKHRIIIGWGDETGRHVRF